MSGSEEPSPDGPPTTPLRPGLSRAVVVAAAMAVIDAEGIDALSMRRLGEALGVQAMTLYRHVDNRDHLLDLVVDNAMDELAADPHVLLHPEDTWQDYLRAVAHAARELALARPRLFPLLCTRPPSAPWIRPPLRSLRWIETFLTILRSREFDDDQAVYVYRGFTSFLLGHLLLEIAAMGIETGPAPQRPQPVPEPDLGDFPTVLRLADALTEDHSAEEFRDSLDNLLDRMAEVTGR